MKRHMQHNPARPVVFFCRMYLFVVRSMMNGTIHLPPLPKPAVENVDHENVVSRTALSHGTRARHQMVQVLAI